MVTEVQARFRIRNDTAANWATVNPTLMGGEPGYDRTNRRLKIGDGATNWATLQGLSIGTASDVAFTPAGSISATTVQAAIVEVAAEAQPLDAQLTTIAALAPAADQIIYWTGLTAASMTSLTATGRSLIAATGTTGTGTVVALSVGPTFTGTLAAAAATFSGNVTVGDNVADAHIINGGVTVNTAASPFTIDATTGNLAKIRFFHSGSVAGSIGANASNIFSILNASGSVRFSFTDTGAVFQSGASTILTLSATGVAIIGDLSATGVVIAHRYTVGTLPAASSVAGARCGVTDASNNVFAAVVAAGGSLKMPVYSDGANWIIG